MRTELRRTELAGRREVHLFDEVTFARHPYAEVDGKSPALESKFSFQDRMSGND